MVTIVGDPDGVPESGARRENNSRAQALLRLFEMRMQFYGERHARIVNASAADPAALLGPAREPAEWSPRDEAGDEEC